MKFYIKIAIALLVIVAMALGCTAKAEPQNETNKRSLINDNAMSHRNGVSMQNLPKFACPYATAYTKINATTATQLVAHPIQTQASAYNGVDTQVGLPRFATDRILFANKLLPDGGNNGQYVWARVLKNTVNLYTTWDCSKITMTLQQSYYLRILQTLDTVLLVSVMPTNVANFPQITGYVRKIEVELCQAEPIAPYYPTVTLTVTGSAALLMLSPVPSAQTVITALNTQTVSYYGSIVSYGNTWYYVYYCGQFGYVLPENLSTPNVPMHPTPLPMPDLPVVSPGVEDDVDQDTDVTPISPTSELVLILFVVLLAVGLCLALFLPGNTKRRNGNVFDEAM